MVFLNNSSLPKDTIREITKGQTAAGNVAIEPIDFGRLFDVTAKPANFMQFLRSKGRVNTTNNYFTTFVEEQSNQMPVLISSDETGSAILETDPVWNVHNYHCSLMAGRVKATDLAVEGNTWVDVYSEGIRTFQQNIMNSIEFNIMSPSSNGIAGSFDSFFATSTSLSGTPTIADIDTQIATMEAGIDYVPDFICGEYNMIKALIDEDGHDRVTMAPVDRMMGTNFIGFLETGFGYLPLIVSDVLDNNTPALALGCSTAYEVRVLDGIRTKEIRTTDFSREGLVGAFVSACLMDGEAVVYWTPE